MDQAVTVQVNQVSASPAQTRIAQGVAWRYWLLWLVLGELLVLYAPTILWLWDRWTMSVWHHAHGLLILLVVVYLVWHELREHRGLPVSSSPWGFVLLVPALIMLALDAGMNTQLLSAASLVIALPALSFLLLGNQRTKAILFPLSILMLTLPIPLAFTESLHLELRKIATLASANLVPWFGIPVFAEGTMLLIPAGSLQVSDACSGFSTLYASVTVSFLVAYLCPDTRQRVLVLLAAAPLAIAVNIVRVVLLVLLVEWQGLEILRTSLHTISGLFTFLLALPVIFWLGQPPQKERIAR